MEGMDIIITTPPNPRPGRVEMDIWRQFRADLLTLRNQPENWYSVNLRGASFQYARRIAGKLNFMTAQDEPGRIKVKVRAPHAS